MDDFVTTSSPEHDPENPVISIDSHEGDFQKLIPRVVALVAVLEHMGPLAAPLRKFLYELIELDDFLNSIPAIQRSGVPAFWRVNLPDILDRIINVIVSADKVLDEIKKVLDEQNA